MKLILAPLRGLTEEPFRTVYQRHFSGVDAAMAPFIPTTSGAKLRDTHVRDVLPERQTMPVVPQLLSNNPADFLVLANRLYGLGYHEINWNLGCPYPMVTKKQRGSGLLPYPERIAAFLAKVMPVLKPRLSIKLRLGYHAASEINALISVLNAFELANITLHPRLGVQMYSGHADIEAFTLAANAIRHPMVYNGDINTMQAFTAIRQRLPQINTFMLGRYVLVNPFLPAELRGEIVAVSERQSRFKAFYDDLFSEYEARLSHPRHLMDRMKGYWQYFAAGFGVDGHKAIKKIQRAQTLENFCKYSKAFWRTMPTPITNPWLP